MKTFKLCKDFLINAGPHLIRNLMAKDTINRIEVVDGRLKESMQRCTGVA